MSTTVNEPPAAPGAADPLDGDGVQPAEVNAIRARLQALEERIHAGEQRRRAMLHIMSDLTETNRRLSDQRRAMLHILADYEKDRADLAHQTDRLNNSRRALMHILQDAHESNVKLAQSRKAMIHIMDDLHKTTEAISARELELRVKQEQLVQAAKLATLGELTTGVAHELNNPLNNIGLYVGNVLDMVAAGEESRERVMHDLSQAMRQVQKATEIINHLRVFGRAAPTTRSAVHVNEVVERSLSLLQEQLRLRQVEVDLQLSEADPVVLANAIQLEQVLMNLLTNAHDAVNASHAKRITIRSQFAGDSVRLVVEDTGPGIPKDLEERIFDPFFTTKDVGEGTGLGLSIVYGIVKEHGGSIAVQNEPGAGARFVIDLPIAESADV